MWTARTLSSVTHTHTHTPICIEVLIIIWQYVRNPVIKYETTYAYAGSCERESEKWVVLRHRRVLLLLCCCCCCNLSQPNQRQSQYVHLYFFFFLGLFSYSNYNSRSSLERWMKQRTLHYTDRKPNVKGTSRRKKWTCFFFLFSSYIYLFICRLLHQCCFFHSVCVSWARLMDLDALRRLLLLFFLFLSMFFFSIPSIFEIRKSTRNKTSTRMMTSRVESLSSARIVTVLYA